MEEGGEVHPVPSGELFLYAAGTTEWETWKKRDLNIYFIRSHRFTNEETVKGVGKVKGRI